MEQDERDFILRSAERVEAWETTPRAFADPYRDMTSEEKSKLLIRKDGRLEELERQSAESERQHSEVVGMLRELLLNQSRNDAGILKALEESRMETSELRSELEKSEKEKARLLRVIERQAQEISDLKASGKVGNKNLYGSKSLRTRPSGKKAEQKSRRQDKDDHDGTPGSAEGPVNDTVTEDNQNTEETKRTEAQKLADLLRKGSEYRRMGANETIVHHSNPRLLPPGAQYIKKVSRFAYEQKVTLVEHEYELVTYKLDGKFHTVYLPAEGEPQHIDRVPGTKASAELMAHLGFNRFCLDTPLYREIRRLGDEGMTLSCKTLTNWLYKGAQCLAPLIGILKETALEKDSVVNCDETWCRVKVLDQYRKRYIWCLVNREARIVIYCYEDGARSRDALKNIIGDSQLKALQTDGYNVYFYLDNDMVSIDHVCCLAHARAKFKYAAECGANEDAIYILDCIGELYALEKTYEMAGLTADRIGEARRMPASLEIIGRLRSKLDVLISPDHPPRGELMEKAVRYLDSYWKSIFRYIDDGRFSIDNNVAERFIRPLAGERKNSLFFGSHKMAKASAVYHTVISTCRMMEISALNFLKKFFRAIVKGETDYHRLLPQTINV